jgi:hypothetical protein
MKAPRVEHRVVTKEVPVYVCPHCDNEMAPVGTRWWKPIGEVGTQWRCPCSDWLLYYKGTKQKWERRY